MHDANFPSHDMFLHWNSFVLKFWLKLIFPVRNLFIQAASREETEEVRAQAAFTIGQLSKNELFRKQVAQHGVVELLVATISDSSEPTVSDARKTQPPTARVTEESESAGDVLMQCGFAVAIREMSQSWDVAKDFLKAGVAVGLITLLGSSRSRRVRKHVLATIVPLLCVSSEM